MRRLSTSDPDFARAFAGIRQRGADAAAAVEPQVRRIVEAVRRRGDRALVDFSRRFDGVTLDPTQLRVSAAEVRQALRSVPADAVRALRLAARRITEFHRHQLPASWTYRDALGFQLGQQVAPLARVGLYVPGGHAAYPS